MSEITTEQRICVLVYQEEHPTDFPPEISKATGVDCEDVILILREHEAAEHTYRVEVDAEFDYETAVTRAEQIGEDAKVVDITPCAFFMTVRNGHRVYCEMKGEHDTHLIRHMGEEHEFDKDGKEI